jgi:hypothetical protein
MLRWTDQWRRLTPLRCLDALLNKSKDTENGKFYVGAFSRIALQSIPFKIYLKILLSLAIILYSGKIFS